MNPRIPTEPDPQLSNYLSNFIKYLKRKDYSFEYRRDIIASINEYFDNHELTNPDDLATSVSNAKRYTVISIRLFLNYLEEQKVITESKAREFRSVLHANDTVGVDLYVPDTQTVTEAYHKLQNEKERLYFYLLTASGIRITELVTLLSIFDKKKVIKGTNFNKYPLSDNRGTKRAYYVYYPNHIELHRMYKVYGSSVKKVFYRVDLPAKYLRKWQYNFLLSNGVPEGVCDYIQGRAEETIGSMHYLNKVKLADEYYGKIADKLREVLT